MPDGWLVGWVERGRRAYDLRDVRPVGAQLAHEVEALEEVVAFLGADAGVVGVALLQVDGRDDGDAVADEGVGDAEGLFLQNVHEVDDPVRVRGDQVGRVLQEDFGDADAEVAQPEREDKWVVQEAHYGVVDHLREEPRAPVVSLLLELLRGPVGEFG